MYINPHFRTRNLKTTNFPTGTSSTRSWMTQSRYPTQTHLLAKVSFSLQPTMPTYRTIKLCTMINARFIKTRGQNHNPTFFQINYTMTESVPEWKEILIRKKTDMVNLPGAEEDPWAILILLLLEHHLSNQQARTLQCRHIPELITLLHSGREESLR